jgi:hypothetical protein
MKNKEQIEITCEDGSVVNVTVSFGRTQAEYEYPVEDFGSLPDESWPVDGGTFEVDGDTYRFGDWDLVDGTATASVEKI